MTQPQSGDGTDDPSSPAFGKCPKCGAAMKLVHIIPERPGYEQRTYKCKACGEATTSEVVQLD